MIPLNDWLIFLIAALILVISPGPNMIYLLSRTLAQGKLAGFTSLAGVMCGFIFHIVLVSFGLTAILFAIPYAYLGLKTLGTIYLLYLAFQAFRPHGKNMFETSSDLRMDKPKKLFLVGFLTNVLNPKVAVFYLSFFPQFIKPEHGSVFIQSIELGVAQALLSFLSNSIIIFFAAKMALFFSKKPLWLKMQRWFMGTVLTTLALKMAFTETK